ncbi:hypothetical protein [Actinokineospora iranica]|uniref:Uncharacterized protein n=1 Tax=Actinokineospora iranica TaxID=1271860 RepID=A0A1G6IMZ8_9PSEU|nr:hypothetical protein [Actinokineospora iranica]SDC07932.1 hypothetical protein SAMN05216174_10128 [Actinokineospora iranica]
MSIDPAHLPLLGNVEPADPPSPVRAASVLLLAHVTVTGGHLALVWAKTGQDLSLFAVPLGLIVWFALSVRGGRDWARLAVLLVAPLVLLLTLTVSSGAVDLAAVALSALLVGCSAHQMFRADVADYFAQAGDQADRV